jgi:RimJ/RimL family protein N-acetyltransferase
MFPEITRDEVFRIETRRLWLRWPRMEDAVEIAAAAGRRELADMTALIPHPYPPGAAEDFVARTRQGNATGDSLTLLATLARGERKVAGALSLAPKPDGVLELGYWIAPQHWGEGYATEAAQALVDTVFGITSHPVIEASARVINPASQRVLQKCGFSWIGSGLQTFPARGGVFAVERFELRRRTWSSLRAWAAPATAGTARQAQLEACIPA